MRAPSPALLPPAARCPLPAARPPTATSRPPPPAAHRFPVLPLPARACCRYTHAKRFASLVRCSREAVWPDGKLGDPTPWPGTREVYAKRAQMRQRALRAQPPVLTNVLGVRASRAGLLKLHAFLQSPVLVTSLLFTVLDALLKELYDDIYIPVWAGTPGNAGAQAPADNSILSFLSEEEGGGGSGGLRGRANTLRQRVGSTVRAMLPSGKGRR